MRKAQRAVVKGTKSFANSGFLQDSKDAFNNNPEN